MSARILIIEDNPTNMELMRYLLQAFGHAVHAASDGRQGLISARYEMPDLIICDIHLPKLDGFGVVRKLKDDPCTQVVPVIAVTAQAMVGDRDKLLSAGFDGYICKPIEPECFVAQVDAFLPIGLRSRQARCAESATADTVLMPARPSTLAG
jgi:CheY-like chemotaxis protein